MSFIVSEYGLFALSVFAAAAALLVYPVIMNHMKPVSDTYIRLITGVSVVEQDASVEPTLPDGNPAKE